MEKKLDQLERNRSRSKSPEKAVTGQRPTSRSPSPSVENRENRVQPVKSSFPARRFDQTQGRRPWTPPPVRSFPFRSAGTTNQSQNIQRGRGRNDRQTAMSPPRPARIQPPIQRVLNTPPRGKSGCYVCGRYGCHTYSTMMMDSKRMGRIEVFPLSLHLPPQLSVVDRSRETTSGTRVRAPGLRRIRSARSLVRSSS